MNVPSTRVPSSNVSENVAGVTVSSARLVGLVVVVGASVLFVVVTVVGAVATDSVVEVVASSLV
jgi:hypothetical protein